MNHKIFEELLKIKDNGSDVFKILDKSLSWELECNKIKCINKQISDIFTKEKKYTIAYVYVAEKNNKQLVIYIGETSSPKTRFTNTPKGNGVTNYRISKTLKKLLTEGIKVTTYFCCVESKQIADSEFSWTINSRKMEQCLFSSYSKLTTDDKFRKHPIANTRIDISPEVNKTNKLEYDSILTGAIEYMNSPN